MMKKTLLIASVLLVNMASWGQTTRDAMLANTIYCTGLYMPYPIDSIVSSTPLPEGYEPFYVSHYGRHGSRFLAGEADYRNLLIPLSVANDLGNFTPQGREVYQTVLKACEDAQGRAGELAPLGYSQHRGIASRLAGECAQAFQDSAQVTAVSTVFMRCAHSMFAFVSELQRQFPEIDVPMESSQRHMHYLSANNSEAVEYYRDRPYQAKFDAFRAAKIKPERMMSQLFVNPENAGVDPAQFLWQLYMLAIDLPNVGGGQKLLDVFTPYELFDLWQVFNYEYYTLHSVNPDNGGAFVESVKALLQNMLDQADEYIADNRHGATLRFGHDSSVIPLAALLRFPTASGRDGNPDSLYLSYADYRVSPMAANIQIRFYRNKQGDTLVKFLLNEQEMPLGDTPAFSYPYYRWDDARATLKKFLETPYK